MRVYAAIVVSALSLTGCVTPSKVVEQRPVSLSAAQTKRIQDAVTYSLIDPTSPLFRNIKAKHFIREDGTQDVTFCGQVNAKNRMGGYVGFTHFYGSFPDPKAASAPVIKFMDKGGEAWGNAYMLCSNF